MVSRVVLNEVAYAFRLWLSSVPSVQAPAEQRSYFYLMKAEALESLAAVEPCVAAQALQLADKARREAHAIALDY